jgi:hypothetical protein
MLGVFVLVYYGQVIEAARPTSHPSPGRDAQAIQPPAGSDSTAAQRPPTADLSGKSTGEIENIEAQCRAIMKGQPIERWRFASVRSRYLALLKRAGDDPAVEEAIRVRLAQVTRWEQAAEAARSIQSILDASHRRDREVARLKQRIAAAGRPSARGYSAVGFMQPSAKAFDGRKLYLLIANDGSTVAYLDIPPGLDPTPLVAGRVGVRGTPHFNEDLGARLITVRDIENLEARR